MIMRHRRILVSAITVGLVAASAVFAVAQTPVHCGDFVTNGVLTADLDCPDNPLLPSVTIGHRGTLDLAGFTLSGGEEGVVCQRDCTILGPGAIRDMAEEAVQAYDGVATISDVTLTNNQDGVNVKNLVARGVIVTANENLGMIISKSASLVDCEVSSNGNVGIAGFYRNRLTMDGCTVRDNRSGIQMGRAKVTNSSILDNGTIGILAKRVLKVTDTVATGNGLSEACDPSNWPSQIPPCGDLLAPRLRATNVTCDRSAVTDTEYSPLGNSWGVCSLD